MAEPPLPVCEKGGLRTVRRGQRRSQRAVPVDVRRLRYRAWFGNDDYQGSEYRSSFQGSPCM
jgi:hypothetical protein